MIGKVTKKPMTAPMARAQLSLNQVIFSPIQAIAFPAAAASPRGPESAASLVSGSIGQGGGLVLGVAVLALLLLVGYPLLWLLLGALGLPGEPGLEHFVRVYTRAQNFEPLKNTLTLALGTGLLSVALEFIKRVVPSAELDQALASGVRRVQLSRQVAGDWDYQTEWLFIAPRLYGDVLMVQHLISRSHLHGGRTFEGRLTLQELMGRLRRMGYFETKGIQTRDPYEAFEEAVAGIVASGPSAVYYAVDRSDYLDRLKTVYEKKRKTK